MIRFFAWRSLAVFFSIVSTSSAFAATFGNDGAPWLIDSEEATRIEAENYDNGGNGGAWFDSTLDNLGGQFRIAGPDIQTTRDLNGGFNIGWVVSGEYLQYTVQARVAGTYRLVLRSARQPGGDAIIRIDASPNSSAFIGGDSDSRLLVEEFLIPSTGGWQVWQSNSVDIQLEQGVQTLQLQARSGTGFEYNLNWLSLELIEAEEGSVSNIHPDIERVLDIDESEILFGPGGDGWADSYSVGDQCYCDSTFDHNVGGILVDGPNGEITVQEACALIGEGPGRAGNPIYNDVQCGNGPANNAGDEDFCPGRVDIGKPGCAQVGPTWKF